MKIFFQILILFSFQYFFGQNIVKGNITDIESSSPLSNSYIFINELNKGTAPNEDGSFEFSILGNGTYHIQFSHLGYETKLETITFENELKEISLNIQLKKQLVEINEVVVTSSYINLQENNTYEIEVIDKDDIQKNGGFSVMDIINKVPGVDATTTGPMVSRPVIRGLSSNRVLTVSDGVRFETQQWDDEHGIGINEAGIDKIEIIKGPASLLYGSEAMGGVVNFIKSKPAPVGTIKGNVMTQMSTNNLGWRALANVDGANENINWGISGLGKLFSDYFIDNQSFRVPNTRLLEYGAKAYIGTNKKWGSTNLTYTYNQAFYGILDGKDIVKDANGNIINTDEEKEKYPFEIEAPFHTVIDNRLTSSTTLLSGKSKFDIILNYQNNHRTENEELAGVKKGYKYVDMILQSYTYNVKWYTPIWKKFSTIIGSQGMYQTNKNVSGAQTVLVPDATINDFGFFAVTKYDISNFNFSFGVRYDTRNLNTDDTSGLNYNIPAISRSYDNISSSLGIAYTIEKALTLRASYASGFRSPNLNELTSNGFKLESRRFEVGNSNFKKETNNQFDFNAIYNNNNITLEGSFFVNNINNYIYIAPTGSMVPSNIDPSVNVPEYKFYQSDAEITGGEARLDIHPKSVKWLRFETKYSTLVGKRANDNSYLPMMTPTKLTNTLFFNLNDFGKFSNSSINIGLLSTFDQNQVALNELKTQGYSIVNLGLGTTYKKTIFTLTANNIFDKQYLNHMSRFRSFEIFEPGLNIALSVKIPLDFK